MKNRIIKIFLVIMLILPIMIKASSVKYSPDAINKANNYIRLARFSDRKKYLDLDTNLYVYENGYITSISDYKTGGMLSKTEYELSQVGETSYLTLGQKYWTLTPVQGTNKQYYVENYLDEKARSEEAGVRSTIYAKSEAYVVGNGTYNSPWEFKLYHTVKITPKAFGRVDCLDSNCTKNNTTVTREKIESGTDANFKVIPDNGYKYLANDSCNLKKTSGQNYKISNITSDIRCIVEFYPRTYTLKLMPGTGVTYRNNPNPDKIYLKYTVGTYSNPEATTVLNQIEKPSRIGYQFRGYYYGDTQVIDATGKLVESQRKAITGFNLAGDDIQELVAHWEQNIMYITYDPDGATDYNDPNNSRTATLLYDGSNYSASTGLPNYACKKGDCWFAFSKPGYHGTYYWLVDSTSSTTKINVSTPFAKNQDMFTGNQRTSFEDNYKTYVTLYAEWIECEAGTYKKPGEGGTTCTGCAAGSFQSSSGQGSCIDCAVASYTNSQGQTSCTACQPSGLSGANGTTSAVGQTSCNSSCNKAHVATWKNQVWSNNSTNPICVINTCVKGYHLVNNNCEPNELRITYNANGGSDLKRNTTIPYSVTLYYDGTTYSGDSGLPNYACTGDCFWRLAQAGYHGTSNWLVDSTTATSSTKKINANTSFATNQDVASAMDKLNDFETKAVTEVNLYAEWVACGKGYYISGTTSSTSCGSCGPGTYSDGDANASCTDCGEGTYSAESANSSCTNCVKGSYSGLAASACTACGNGKTTDNAGSTQAGCKDCSQTNVATWKSASWKTDNTGVNNLCTINTCSAGYKLSSNTCVADSFTVTFNVNSGDAWTSTTCGSGYTFNSSSKTCTKAYTYNGTYGSLPTPTRTGYTFAGWYTSASGGTKIETSTKVLITSATTYYAHWDASFQEQDIPEIIIDGNEVLCDKYSKYDDGTPVNFPSCEYITPHLQINAHYNNGTSTVNIKTYYTMHPKNGYGINNGTFYVGGSTENGNTNAGLYINDSLKVEMSYTSGTYRIVKRDNYVNDTALYLHTSSVNPYVYTFTINHNDSGTASFYVELINNAVTQKTSNGARPYDICGDHGGINVPRQLVTLQAQ